MKPKKKKKRNKENGNGKRKVSLQTGVCKMTTYEDGIEGE